MNELNSKRNDAGHLEFYDADGNLAKILYTTGTTVFYKNGEIHRDNDLPAVVDPNNETWYQNGLIHRDGGAAIIFYELGRPVQQFWLQHGVRHREDGPAIEHLEEHRKAYDCYFIDGVLLTKDEFETNGY